MLSNNARVGGPIPKFNDYHLWKTLYYLDDEEAIGRKRLSSLLDIGEGSTRTIISMLQNHGIISINKSGIVLTSAGVDLKKKTRMDLSPVSVKELTIGECNCAVRIPRVAHMVSYGCEERDRAIEAGATGATTLVYIGGKLMFPGSEYRVDPTIESEIKSVFNLKNEDVIVIGTGKSMQLAEMGAVVAGINIMGGLKLSRGIKDVISARSDNSELLSLAFAIHDLVGGLPVCAKNRDNLGVRIENGAVIDNAYTGEVLEEVIRSGTTIRRIATSGPYKGIRVIVTPIELDNRTIAVIGVVDIRSMAGIDNLIRLNENDDLPVKR
jgi:predicted transcriptional regulator